MSPKKLGKMNLETGPTTRWRHACSITEIHVKRGDFLRIKPSYLCIPAEHGHMLRGQQCNIPLFEAIEGSWSTSVSSEVRFPAGRKPVSQTGLKLSTGERCGEFGFWSRIDINRYHFDNTRAAWFPVVARAERGVFGAYASAVSCCGAVLRTSFRVKNLLLWWSTAIILAD